MSRALRRDRAGEPVRALVTAADDASLVAQLRRGNPHASAAVFDRHAPHLERVLARVLGADAELDDVLHDTFVQAFANIEKLNDPQRLKAWLTRIAVFVARGRIRRRRRLRWLRFSAPEELPEPSTADDHDGRAAIARTYRVLDELPSNERIVFTLRFVEGMELAEVAEACGVSIGTVKRRLRRASERFTELAWRDPVLRDRLERGAP